jgi:hypothetical protein
MNRTDAAPVMNGDGLRKAVELAIMLRRRMRASLRQAAFVKYHWVNADQLRLQASEIFIAGMSRGFADRQRIENTLVTKRAEVRAFTTLYAE